MPFQIPVSINFGTLPQTGVGYTPQTLADRLGSNGKIFSEQQMALFTTGTTAPTSNIGPWLKDGVTWYVWDNITGAYVPEVIESQSLKYIISSAPPDETVYDIWYKVDGAGVPLGIFIWYSGAWTDTYTSVLAAYPTTVAMTAAIDAAVVAGEQAFKAGPSVVQDIVFAAPGSAQGVVTLGTQMFDPDGVFAADTFTCTATGYYQIDAAFQSGVTVGAPTNVDTAATIAVNGVDIESLSNESISTVIDGRVQCGSQIMYLVSGDQVTMRYQFTVDLACTVSIDPTFTRLGGYRVR